MSYNGGVPKLWNQTIETHRREVGDAILDTTLELVAKHGPHGVTMSQIAEKTGIGRATLYKYFPDVESILLAWHERHIQWHLEQLAAFRDEAGTPREKLKAVLETYALIRHEHNDPDLAAFLHHRGEHVARAHQQLHDLFRGLLADCVKARDVRDDVPLGELATYCFHALAAAASVSSKAAVRRLVAVTLAGLRRT
jgi:AcrR family transcriptional regulator